jgi:hypothetical protein
MTPVYWLLAGAASGVLLAVAAMVWWLRHREKPEPLPAQWALTPRPVFNAHERLVHQQLRDALPHHVILAKVPLVRFCQPNDPSEVRYWFDLLGSIHVGFAVCAPNGRVLAALDILAGPRPPSRRVTAIKQAVLRTCRVRYVVCRPDQLPTFAELQMLVPQQGLAAHAAVPRSVHSLSEARTTLAHTVRSRRAERPAAGPFGDSRLNDDSFFVPDSRMAEFSQTDPADLPSLPPPMHSGPAPLDTGPGRLRLTPDGELRTR